ncbi:MAG: electron transport complex subunit RsxG [Gammaproteobacteria bacterium]|nr:electron transport complex subunit RsxG [Gammaproteobacteria bacterium]
MAAGLLSRFRDTIGYQALLLGSFSTLATALLVSGNALTREAIAERHREDLLTSLHEVVPAALFDNDLLDQPLKITRADGTQVTVYRGTDHNRVTALAYEAETQSGYSGEIRIIMGVNASGEIIGVRVLSHAETPGLGDKIEVAKNDWILQFNGLSMGNPSRSGWRVKKDGGNFDAFSGATITPRAVLEAIEKGLDFFSEFKPQLITLTTSTVTPLPQEVSSP